MQNNKVLCLGMSSNTGGIERSMFNTFFKYKSLGIDMDFLINDANISYENEIVENGGIIYKMNEIRGVFGFFPNIIKYIKFFNSHKEYKIVHNNLMSFYHIEALIAEKISRVPIRVIHARGARLSSTSIKAKIVQFINKPIALLCGNRYYACSNDAGKFMFGEKKFTVIKNGIDTNKFKFNKDIRNKVRTELNIENNMVYCHIGAFLPVKNHEFLLNVFKKICDRDSNSHLLLIGDGPLREKCISRAKELNINDNITFIGRTDRVNDILCASDKLLFPSISEGFGNVIIEAQSTGLVCHISDTIPKEVDITGLVHRHSIISEDEWVNSILSTKVNHTRENYFESVKSKGYDINDSIKTMIDNY